MRVKISTDPYLRQAAQVAADSYNIGVTIGNYLLVHEDDETVICSAFDTLPEAAQERDRINRQHDDAKRAWMRRRIAANDFWAGVCLTLLVVIALSAVALRMFTVGAP